MLEITFSLFFQLYNCHEEIVVRQEEGQEEESETERNEQCIRAKEH